MKCTTKQNNGNMSPWEIVKQIAGHIYTDEQIDEMTWAECEEVINQEK